MKNSRTKPKTPPQEVPRSKKPLLYSQQGLKKKSYFECRHIKAHFDEQVREDFADLDKMIESIKEVGISQPLTVVQDPKDANFFQIVSGERRWRAAKNWG